MFRRWSNRVPSGGCGAISMEKSFLTWIRTCRKEPFAPQPRPHCCREEGSRAGNRGHPPASNRPSMAERPQSRTSRLRSVVSLPNMSRAVETVDDRGREEGDACAGTAVVGIFGIVGGVELGKRVKPELSDEFVFIHQMLEEGGLGFGVSAQSFQPSALNSVLCNGKCAVLRDLYWRTNLLFLRKVFYGSILSGPWHVL